MQRGLKSISCRLTQNNLSTFRTHNDDNRMTLNMILKLCWHLKVADSHDNSGNMLYSIEIRAKLFYEMKSNRPFKSSSLKQFNPKSIHVWIENLLLIHHRCSQTDNANCLCFTFILEWNETYFKQQSTLWTKKQLYMPCQNQFTGSNIKRRVKNSHAFQHSRDKNPNQSGQKFLMMSPIASTTGLSMKLHQFSSVS